MKRLAVPFAFGTLVLVLAVLWREDHQHASRAEMADAPSGKLVGGGSTDPGESTDDAAPAHATDSRDKPDDPAGPKGGVVLRLVDAKTDRPIWTTQRIYRVDGENEELLYARTGTGSCRFSLPAEREILLRAEAGKYAPSAVVRVRVRPSENGRELTIPLTPYDKAMGRIELTVHTSDGAALDGFWLEVKVVGHRFAGVTAKANSGVFLFESVMPADRYEITVRAAHDRLADGTEIASLFLPTVVQAVVPGGGLSRVRAKLRKGGRVYVKLPPLPIEDGVPEMGSMLEVDWEPIDDIDNPAIGLVAESTTETLESRSYSLPAGRYRFSVWKIPQEKPVAHEVVTVRVGETIELDFTDLAAVRK